MPISDMNERRFCTTCGTPMVRVTEVMNKYSRKSGKRIEKVWLQCVSWRDLSFWEDAIRHRAWHDRVLHHTDEWGE